MDDSLRAYRDYVMANARRPDLLSARAVELSIKKLDERLADPRFAAKKAHYEAERARLLKVLEVMNG